MEEFNAYRLPIFKSLTQTLGFMGVPRGLMIFNGTLFAILVYILHVWYIVILNIAIHFVAVHFAKKDPQFWDCFKRYIAKKKYYST